MTARWAAVAALLAAACGHSTPCCDALTGSAGPFDTANPTRLTFASGANIWPAFSWDGASLAYQFDRGTADRDRCAGLLPSAGGQRIGRVCAWELTEAGQTDIFTALTPMAGNAVAFVRYTSALGATAPQTGGLYVGQLDAARDARLVLPLLAMPAGASARYDFLLRPVRTGPDQLLALAGQTIIGPRVLGGPIDTVYIGIEVVRLDLGEGNAVVTPIADADGAADWAYDESVGTIYFHRPTYAPATPVSQFQVVADTVFRVSVTGGTPTAFWGQPEEEVLGLFAGPVVQGLAAAEGRVWVSHWFSRIPPGGPGSPETRSVISEIHGDGATTELGSTVQLGSSGTRWARIAADPSGTRLAAELLLGPTRDLYLIDLP
jgi:hypothetical protein